MAFSPDAEGGGSIKGAGENAEFFHIGPNNELWSSPLAGRPNLTLNEDRQISRREDITAYASQGRTVISVTGHVYQFYELIQPKSCSEQ
jgi:hypothetical protein